MGRRSRQIHNKTVRANGNEPEPGPFAGVKRWMRYLKRVPCIVSLNKIKHPERYLARHGR